jgi:hypothetical protein
MPKDARELDPREICDNLCQPVNDNNDEGKPRADRIPLKTYSPRGPSAERRRPTGTGSIASRAGSSGRFAPTSHRPVWTHKREGLATFRRKNREPVPLD